MYFFLQIVILYKYGENEFCTATRLQHVATVSLSATTTANATAINVAATNAAAK